MSETRSALVRLAAQHDIHGVRFNAFLDALDRNLDAQDAANVQELLRSTLAPGYAPVFVFGDAGAAEIEPEPPAGPHEVHVVSRLVHGDAGAAFALRGVFDLQADADALFEPGVDTIFTLELNREYPVEHALVVAPATAPEEVLSPAEENAGGADASDDPGPKPRRARKAAEAGQETTGGEATAGEGVQFGTEQAPVRAAPEGEAQPSEAAPAEGRETAAEPAAQPEAGAEAPAPEVQPAAETQVGAETPPTEQPAE